MGGGLDSGSWGIDAPDCKPLLLAEQRLARVMPRRGQQGTGWPTFFSASFTAPRCPLAAPSAGAENGRRFLTSLVRGHGHGDRLQLRQVRLRCPRVRRAGRLEGAV